MSVEAVRLLIPDLLPDEGQIFTDTQIELFLSLNGQDVRLAAADALEVAATDEIMTYKITRTDDQSVNGVAGGELLLNRAEKLREEALGNLNSAFQVFYPHAAVQTRPEAAPLAWL